MNYCLLPLLKLLKKSQICPDAGCGSDGDKDHERYIDHFIDQIPLLEAWHFGFGQSYQFKTGQHPAMKNVDPFDPLETEWHYMMHRCYNNTGTSNWEGRYVLKNILLHWMKYRYGR